MIVGNPKAGRKIVGIAIGILVVIGVITLIVTLRKKEAPAQGPPLLRPSILILL
jgi:hypothetical protein